MTVIPYFMRNKLLLRIGAGVIGVCIVAALTWFVASVWRLEVPVPTGPHAVGRLRLSWMDESRAEPFRPGCQRELIAEVWYPAQPQSGSPGPYFPELGATATEMIRLGYLSSFEARGLDWIRSHSRGDASFAELGGACPVVILSPGNSTNIEYYSVYAEELASRGFVVLGVNHPYDVGAVRLSDGTIASYRERLPGDQAALSARMVERVADVRFLVDCLEELNRREGPLAGHLDLAKIGIMGHSLGGMTAGEACTADKRFAAGINIDGLHAGNPYGARPDATAPPQPFTYIGKTRTIGPRTEKLLAENPQATLVQVPDAQHMDFADTNQFAPALNPWDRSAYRALIHARGEVVAFFERWLR